MKNVLGDNSVDIAHNPSCDTLPSYEAPDLEVNCTALLGSVEDSLNSVLDCNFVVDYNTWDSGNAELCWVV